MDEEIAPMAGAADRHRDALVEVDDLAKHYGTIRAVDGISFTVRRGDVLGFLGPNGAGKTTAMKMICGFLAPDRGSARVAGHDIATDSLAARRRIGYLPENAPAYADMTVDRFLRFIAEVRELGAEAIEKAIERTGLQEVRRQTIDTLSKGFKRRVGLAQALLHDPDVLVLDEPTDGLDPNQKVLVHRLIDELAGEKAILLSTHILDEVERVCNRAIIISQGRILVDSTPDRLIAQAPHHNSAQINFASPPGDELLGRLEALPWCEALRRDGDRTVVVVPREGSSHLPELLDALTGVEVTGIRQQEGRLDDLFRQVTEGVST